MPVLVEIRTTVTGERDALPVPGNEVPNDQVALDRRLPHGQSGTRGPPRLEDLRVGTRTRVQPLEKIQDEHVDGVELSDGFSLSDLTDGPSLCFRESTRW